MDQAKVGTNWWTRPCGGFEVLRLAIPLIVSTGSLSLMNFTDRMFLMWWDTSTLSMTASMQAGLLFWTLVAIPNAIAMFVTTFVAQYRGSGNPNRIGPVVWQGIWFGLVVMPFLVLFGPFFAQAFEFFKHSPELIVLEDQYLYWVLWGSGAVIAGEAAASFFRGRGKMNVEMYVNVFCVLLNVVLDYCWIFGCAGFPAWGLAGAAIATTVSQWARLFLYIGLMLQDDGKEGGFNILSGMKPDIVLLGRLFYFGIPSGSYTFVDTLSFTVFLMLIGGLGVHEAGATTLAFTLNLFTFLPLVGIGIVVTSMVGNQLGNNRPDLARRATNTAAIIGLTYTALFGILYLAIPNLLLEAFASFTKPEEFEAVRGMSVILLRFVALYLFFDSCIAIFASALRGAGDTVYVMKTTLILAPFLPLLCWLGIRYMNFGVYGCWAVLTAWVWIFSAFFALRFFGGKWEKMRVIETELLKKTDAVT